MTSYFSDDEFSGSAYDSRIVARLTRYLRPYLRLLVLAGILVILIAGLNALGPLIVKEAIDDQIRVGRSDQLGNLVLAYLGVLLGAFILSFLQAVLMAYVGQRVMLDMRYELFRHLEKLSITFFDRNPVGRLLTRVTNDISTLEQVLSQGVVETLTNLVSLVAIIITMLLLDLPLAMLMFACVPFLLGFVRAVSIAQRKAFRDQRTWLSRLNAYLNEQITGIAVIQLFNRQRRNFAGLNWRNQGLLAANLRVTFWYAVFEPMVVIFNAVTISLILWYGGGRAIDETLTLGTLVAFLQYMQRFFWPIRELAERYTTIQQALAGCERIFAILDEPEEISDPEDPVELGKVRGEIEFRNVWFAYDADNWVLRDVSFVIRPGEKVAVVGATGAGKSTLTNLLNRFYDVQRGQILIDGVPVTRLRQRQLRRQVGLVLQDAFIFTDTVSENIRLRDPSISEKSVKDAARLVGAESFVLNLQNGYETVLAERGANLSTGQKQLIAMARVAAFDPQIVLVMDEATASIDPETEDLLQRSMKEVMEGRTSIIIAHRLNTIRHVDRILVLQRGRIVEEGTHADLLAKRGTYSHLYELQYKDQDVGGIETALTGEVPKPR